MSAVQQTWPRSATELAPKLARAMAVATAPGVHPVMAAVVQKAIADPQAGTRPWPASGLIEDLGVVCPPRLAIMLDPPILLDPAYEPTVPNELAGEHRGSWRLPLERDADGQLVVRYGLYPPPSCRRRPVH